MKKEDQLRHIVRKTRFGPAVILWETRSDRPVVRQILISRPGQPAETVLKEQFPDAVPFSCGLIDDLAGRIAAFLDGPMSVLRSGLCNSISVPRFSGESFWRNTASRGVP